MSEQTIWTLDRHLQEVEDQITPMEEAKKEIYQTGRELMLGIANVHMNERLWSTLPGMQKKLGELRRKYDLLRHFASEKRHTWEGKDFEKKKEAAGKDIYWFKKEAKIPVIRELLGAKVTHFGDVREGPTQNLRMAMAYALDLNNLVRFSCNGNFDHYKTPSDCGTCNDAEENIRLAGIEDFFEHRKHRIYGVDWDKIQEGILDTTWHIRNEETRDNFYEKAKDYTRTERPSEEHLAGLKEKKKTLECYKMEEAKKIQGAVRDLTSKMNEILE